MDLSLTFADGILGGDGNDDVGLFLLRARTGECYWTKTYPGSHDVFYRGFREGKGIWGTWEIHTDCHGGFHIWPRSASEGEEQIASAEQAAPVDAVTREEEVTPKPIS
jgi:hypothetical protein